METATRRNGGTDGNPKEIVECMETFGNFGEKKEKKEEEGKAEGSAGRAARVVLSVDQYVINTYYLLPTTIVGICDST